MWCTHRSVLLFIFSLALLQIIINPVFAYSSDPVILNTNNQNWAQSIVKGDTVLLVYTGDQNSAISLSDSLIRDIASQRGYSKIVRDTRHIDISGINEDYKRTLNSFGIIKTVYDTQIRSESAVGLLGYGTGANSIGDSLYILSQLQETDFSKMKFREVIFLGPKIPYSSDLMYIQTIIKGKTTSQAPAFFVVFTNSDLYEIHPYLKKPEENCICESLHCPGAQIFGGAALTSCVGNYYELGKGIEEKEKNTGSFDSKGLPQIFFDTDTEGDELELHHENQKCQCPPGMSDEDCLKLCGPPDPLDKLLEWLIKYLIDEDINIKVTFPPNQFPYPQFPRITESGNNLPIIRTDQNNWQAGLQPNDDILVVLSDDASIGSDIDEESINRITIQRGYTKAVVVMYSPDTSWSGAPLETAQRSYELAGILADIEKRTGTYAGIYAEGARVMEIVKAANYISGYSMPTAPQLIPSPWMENVRFKEVIVAGPLSDTAVNNENLQYAVAGTFGNDTKAIISLPESPDLQDRLIPPITQPAVKPIPIPNIPIPPVTPSYEIQKQQEMLRQQEILRQIRMNQENVDRLNRQLQEQSNRQEILRQIRMNQENVDRLNRRLQEQNTIILIQQSMKQGGIDFSDIQMSSISIKSLSSGSGNTDIFNYVMSAKTGSGGTVSIDPEKSTKLAYDAFFIALTVPDKMFWVNLNPWEPKRLIGEGLEKTDVGKVMLDADLQMKRDISNYGNPCAGPLGEHYWAQLEEKRKELAASLVAKHPGELTNPEIIFFLPVTRHWIVPDRVEYMESGDQVYIVNSSLSIKSEEVDEHSGYKIKDLDSSSFSETTKADLQAAAIEFSKYNRKIDEQDILPLEINDVNTAPRFADLRNVYHSIALAQWYKNKYRNSAGMYSAYLDTSNLSGLTSLSAWTPENIWEGYRTSFEKGEYTCEKKEQYISGNIEYTQIHTYTAGGVDFIDIPLEKTVPITTDVQIMLADASTNLYSVDSSTDIYLGDSIIRVQKTGGPAILPEEKVRDPSDPDSGWFSTLLIFFTQYGILIIAGVIVVVTLVFLRMRISGGNGGGDIDYFK